MTDFSNNKDVPLIRGNGSIDAFSTDPRDVGITVVGGLTGNGDMTQSELDQKVEAVKESLRPTPLIKESFEVLKSRIQ